MTMPQPKKSTVSTARPASALASERIPKRICASSSHHSVMDTLQNVKLSGCNSKHVSVSSPPGQLNVQDKCSRWNSRASSGLSSPQRRAQSAPSHRLPPCADRITTGRYIRPGSSIQRLDSTLSWSEALRHIRRWQIEGKSQTPRNLPIPRGNRTNTDVPRPTPTDRAKRKVSFNLLNEGASITNDNVLSNPTVAPYDPSVGSKESHSKDREESSGNGPAKLTMAAAARIVTKVSAHKLLVRRRNMATGRFGRIAWEEMDTKRLRTLRRLRSVLQSVKIVCSVSIRMRNQTKDATQRSGITTLLCQNGNESYHLFFDKWEFSRANSHKLSLSARIAASGPPELRTPADIDIIYNVLKNLVDFKEKFSDHMKRELCKVVWYMTCEKGRVVVRQGHQGNHFYLIYSGSVLVRACDDDPSVDDVTELPEVTKYGPGSTFGEVALLEDEGRRTATVVCNETTELFQIDRADFLSVCGDLFRQELQTKIALARCQRLFDNWDEEALTELCKKAVIRPLPYGDVLERNWRNARHLYLVIQGKLELLVEVKADQKVTETHRASGPMGFMESILNQVETETNLGAGNQNIPETIAASQDLGLSHSSHPGVSTGGFISVGLMYPGTMSDVRVICSETVPEVRPIILVSLGVTVLRFSTSLIQKLAPPQANMNFISSHFTPPSIPETEELERTYKSNLKWNKLRGMIGQTFLWQQQPNTALAFIPASLKAY